MIAKIAALVDSQIDTTRMKEEKKIKSAAHAKSCFGHLGDFPGRQRGPRIANSTP